MEKVSKPAIKIKLFTAVGILNFPVFKDGVASFRLKGNRLLLSITPAYKFAKDIEF